MCGILEGIECQVVPSIEFMFAIQFFFFFCTNRSRQAVVDQSDAFFQNGKQSEIYSKKKRTSHCSAQRGRLASTPAIGEVTLTLAGTHIGTIVEILFFLVLMHDSRASSRRRVQRVRVVTTMGTFCGKIMSPEATSERHQKT